MAEPGDAQSRWARAAEDLHWARPWDALLDGGPPGRWFAGGELNVSVNCLDRHLAEHADTVAIFWEGEPGDRRAIPYRELYDETLAFAQALTKLAVGPGDRVALYLGWVPEAVVAMLACARIGAVFSLLPASLPVEALAEQISALAPRVLVTQDGSWRHGEVLPLKAQVDEAVGATSTVEHVVVVRRTGMEVSWYESDHWYHDLLAEGPPATLADPAAFPADHPLLVYQVPGPDGLRRIVHRSAGLLLQAATVHRHIFEPRRDDVFWCAMEISFVGGTVHGVLGPLAHGVSTVMFEGMVDTPTRDRAWEIVERYRVTSFLTFPTVIGRLRRWSGGRTPDAGVSSLRIVVTAGEPLETRDREWLVSHVGGTGLAVLDGWGQTELGGIVTVKPVAGADPLPDPGLDIVDHAGRSLAPGMAGELVLRRPWAGTFLEIHEEPEAARPYWGHSESGSFYRTGDIARREDDGTITILERLDPMVKVTGQLVSVASVANVLSQHPHVRAAEVIQVPDPEGGRLLVAGVVPDPGTTPGPELASDLCNDLHEMLGGLSVPHAVAFVESFPADLSPTDRRRALRTLATAAHSSVFSVTTQQLLTAVLAGD